MQRIVEKDGVIYARLTGDLNDQDLQPEFNRMITQKGGYVIMANLYARARASNTDFMARQVLAQVLKGITTDSSKMPSLCATFQPIQGCGPNCGHEIAILVIYVGVPESNVV